MLSVGAVQAEVGIKYDNKGYKSFAKDLGNVETSVDKTESKFKTFGKNASTQISTAGSKVKEFGRNTGSVFSKMGTQVTTAGSKMKTFGKNLGGSVMTGVKKLGGGLKTVGGSLMNVGRMALGGLKSLAKFGAVGAAAVVGVVYAFGKLVGMGAEVQKGIEQTQQVIKTTGGAANVTAKDIDDLTGRLSNMSGVDDDLIRVGSNMLLTFKNIRNETGKGNKIFNQATTAALDMSVAMGEDMKSSSIRLGKALNDPIKGVSALSRVGVQFTEQQKRQIETMVESGKQMEAQKLILGELQSQFGGQAKKQMQPIDRLKVNIENLGESIGLKLLPNAEKGANAINSMVVKFMKDFEDGSGAAGKFGKVIENVSGKVVGFLKQMAAGTGTGGKFMNWLSEGADKIGKFVQQMIMGQGKGGEFNEQLKTFAQALMQIAIALKAAIPLITLLSTLSSGLLKAFNSLDSGTQTFIISLIALAKIFMMVRNAALAMGVASSLSLGPWGIAIAAVIAAILYLITHFDEWKAGMKRIFDWMTSAVDTVKQTLVSAFEWVKDKISDAFALIGKAARMGLIGPLPFLISRWKEIPGFFVAVKDKIVNAFGAVRSFVMGVVNSVANFFKSLPGRAWNGLKKLGDMYAKIGNNITDKFKDVVKKIIDFFKPIPGKMFKIFSSAPSYFASIFDRVGDAIAGGFKAGLNAIISGWNSLEFSTPKIDPPIGPTIPSITIGTPDIPMLADGGVAIPGKMAIVGDGTKKEFVISQEGDKKKNIGLLLQAASALGFPLLGGGGTAGPKKNSKTKVSTVSNKKKAVQAANKQSALENKKSLMERQFSRSGGATDSKEYDRLIAVTSAQIKTAKEEQTALTKRINYLKGVLPKTTNKNAVGKIREEIGTIRDRLNSLKWEIPNLVEDRADLYADKKTYGGDQAQAALDARAETPNYDKKLQALEAELALSALDMSSRTAEDINAEIETTLMDKLKTLQNRLVGVKDRDLINSLNQAIASVAGQIKSMRDEKASSPGSSMGYQMEQYSNARFDALKMGGNMVNNNTKEGSNIKVVNNYNLPPKPHTQAEELKFALENNLR